MKLFSPAWLDKHYSKVMIGAIIIYVLPFVVLIILVGSVFLFPPPPQRFDFSEYFDHVIKIEIVDWTSSGSHVQPLNTDNYRLIITLNESQIPDLLTSLSEVDFYKKGPGDPPGFSGLCFLITLDDGSYRVIGRYGYARYRQGDTRIARYTGLWDHIRDDDFEDLFAPYLGK